MRKFILALAVILTAATTLTSCKDEVFSFDYSFTVSGEADGNVDLTFPGGTLALDGNSTLEFAYNSTPGLGLVVSSSPAWEEMSLEQLAASDNPDYADAAKLVEDSYFSKFAASSASGTYYLHVVGYVREHLTGIEVKIDKVLTNRAPDDDSPGQEQEEIIQ